MQLSLSLISMEPPNKLLGGINMILHAQKTNYNLSQIYRTYVEWKQGINISYLDKNLQTPRLLKTIHIELLRITKSLWVFQINQRHKRQNNIINLYQDITPHIQYLIFLIYSNIPSFISIGLQRCSINFKYNM